MKRTYSLVEGIALSRLAEAWDSRREPLLPSGKRQEAAMERLIGEARRKKALYSFATIASRERDRWLSDRAA